MISYTHTDITGFLYGYIIVNYTNYKLSFTFHIQSSQNMKRENYQMLKRLVRTGDPIVFDSLTRLGRNMNDILEKFKYYEKHQVNLQCINEPFINVNYTGESTNDVIQSTIQKATLTILFVFVEKERHDIKQHQAEESALAKSKVNV